MKKFLFILLVVCVMALPLSGCASFNKLVTNNELVTQLAVEAATARVLHDHPTWKWKAISITNQAIATIDSKASVNLSAVEAFVKANIPWQNLQPEEQALVSVLIDQVVNNLADSFRAQGIDLPEAQLVVVREVLAWINETATRTNTMASEVPK